MERKLSYQFLRNCRRFVFVLSQTPRRRFQLLVFYIVSISSSQFKTLRPLSSSLRSSSVSFSTAAMAESALRKRDLNGNASSLPRRPKVPRGNLPHSKNIPETMGNVLVPPQLKGRSNFCLLFIIGSFVKKGSQ
ncbi:PREDICTED: uncharacterized protein LOC104787900 [Camelina sativa]|uniref:Uncharacterized protein LOC104787900 n=1 Tax=Camelina sativa TaxID=90675 RepID=A0ABM0Z8C8_CAMSA|nr:PREDICTED: uncharacterized protein LOC104787900 [Camelina sativa]